MAFRYNESNKVIKSLLPGGVGLVIAFVLLYLYQLLLESLYTSCDDDMDFAGSLDIYLYFLSFIPLLLFAGLFQYFIAIPIWENFKKGNKFLAMNLWQLLLFSCLIFSGIIVLVLGGQHTLSFANPMLAFSVTFIITIFYWIGNIYTLKQIERNKKIS